MSQEDVDRLDLTKTSDFLKAEDFDNELYSIESYYLCIEDTLFKALSVLFYKTLNFKAYDKNEDLLFEDLFPDFNVEDELEDTY